MSQRMARNKKGHRAMPGACQRTGHDCAPALRGERLNSDALAIRAADRNRR